MPNTDNVILFRTISFAVFPRKIKPQYIETSEKYDCDYNRYITWETATRDIQNQKKTGYKGEKWLLKCKLKIFVSGKKTIVTPEKIKYVRNPELQKYLKSTEYQKYLDDCLIYQDEWEAYRAFRMSYHSFTLPDGSVKSLLLYNRPEEKFAMLRNLGVAESEIQHYRDILANKPVKPVPADLKPLIPQVIPSRSIQKNVWDWKHSIETIERVKSKNNGKTQACKTTKARMPKKTKTEVPVARI